MGISPTTNQGYYSGDWEDIKNIVRALNIGDGKLAKVNQALIESYQEMIDREIDGMLSDLYDIPLVPYNQVQPDGSTKSVFPGDVRRLARYWAAGLLMRSEFQGLEANASEAATQYIDDSKRELFRLIRFNHRIRGQVYRHSLRTMPPTMAPPARNEQDF